MKKKKTIFAAKRKGGLLFLKGFFIIYRLRQAFIGQGSMKKRMFTITIISNFKAYDGDFTYSI